MAPTVAAGGAAEPITRRNWADEWVTVRCGACGREDDWPHPELGCRCGTVLRVPVEPMAGAYEDAVGGTAETGHGAPAVPPRTSPPVSPPTPTPTPPHPTPPPGAFRPVTIRTARDAVAAAAGYLRRLGFRDVVQPEERPVSGVDLRGPGLVAQVDPSTRPAGLRAVECLWLNGLGASAAAVFFSLAGYTPEARSRAAEVGLPLFVLDLTGTPQPVNDAAAELAARGA